MRNASGHMNILKYYESGEALAKDMGEGINQWIAHLEPRASNACSTETISEEECLEAVVGLLPDGQVQGIRHLVAGSWSVPWFSGVSSLKIAR